MTGEGPSGLAHENSSESAFSDVNIQREIDYAKQEPAVKYWKSPTGEMFEVKLPPTVYPPREDTYMISETLISLGKGTGSFLEIGSGSGVVSICANRMGWDCYACDVNPFAVASSIENARTADVELKITEGGPGPSSDESQNPWWFNKQHDLIIWNLPYLRVEKLPNEKLGPLEESALLDNDKIGLAVRALQSIKQNDILKKRGLIVLLLKTEDSFNLINEANMIGLAARVDKVTELSDGDSMCIVKIWHPWSDSPRESFDTIGSTNDYALSNMEKIGSLVSSDKQTSGKGRRKNQWSSSLESIAATWVIANGRSMIDPIASQLVAGYVVHSILENYTEDNMILKWPNDIYKFDGKVNGKISGILVEGKTIGSETKIVCGIGINLYLDRRDYTFPIASFDTDKNEVISKDELIDQLHAGISSIFEEKDNVSKCKMEIILTRISELIRDGSQQVGQYHYKNEHCTINGINQEGLLMISVNGTNILADDSDQIKWDF